MAFARPLADFAAGGGHVRLWRLGEPLDSGCVRTVNGHPDVEPLARPNTTLAATYPTRPQVWAKRES